MSVYTRGNITGGLSHLDSEPFKIASENSLNSKHLTSISVCVSLHWWCQRIEK